MKRQSANLERLSNYLLLGLFCLVFLSPTAYANSLNGSSNPVAGGTIIDLTSEGSADWAHWARTTATSFNHKAGVTQQISDINNVGLRW
ncbi:MAG: hypothetical protein AAF541_16505, partial [Pseudomonadota bacterium]